MKKPKQLPDDISIVVIGIFCCMIFLWFNLESVKNQTDAIVLFGGAGSMIFIPMIISVVMGLNNKVKFFTKVLSWGVRYI